MPGPGFWSLCSETASGWIRRVIHFYSHKCNMCTLNQWEQFSRKTQTKIQWLIIICVCVCVCVCAIECVVRIYSLPQSNTSVLATFCWLAQMSIVIKLILCYAVQPINPHHFLGHLNVCKKSSPGLQNSPRFTNSSPSKVLPNKLLPPTVLWTQSLEKLSPVG